MFNIHAIAYLAHAFYIKRIMKTSGCSKNVFLPKHLLFFSLKHLHFFQWKFNLVVRLHLEKLSNRMLNIYLSKCMIPAQLQKCNKFNLQNYYMLLPSEEFCSTWETLFYRTGHFKNVKLSQKIKILHKLPDIDIQKR